MADLVERVLSGDTRAAARLCRLIDDRADGLRDLLRDLYAAPVSAFLVGVTGSPGAGKSTLVDGLISVFRSEGQRVGVVAVDPTSPFSGGAILGDRIRMQRHFEDPDVFIRSAATRGALGGLSRSTRDLARVLEAWGAGVVLIETVGVGQDELDVTLAADTTVVVLAPGLGDDVQAIKAGILECADVFAVNKSDRPGADATVRDIENMLALGALSPAAFGATHGAARPTRISGPTEAGWTPPIVKTVATTGEGIGELALRMKDHRAWVTGDAGREFRTARTRRWLEGFVRDELAEAVFEDLSNEVSEAVEEVLEKRIDAHAAVERLVLKFRSQH